jgi:hypothetical protein
MNFLPGPFLRLKYICRSSERLINSGGHSVLGINPMSRLVLALKTQAYGPGETYGLINVLAGSKKLNGWQMGTTIPEVTGTRAAPDSRQAGAGRIARGSNLRSSGHVVKISGSWAGVEVGGLIHDFDRVGEANRPAACADGNGKLLPSARKRLPSPGPEEGCSRSDDIQAKLRKKSENPNFLCAFGFDPISKNKRLRTSTAEFTQLSIGRNNRGSFFRRMARCRL